MLKRSTLIFLLFISLGSTMAQKNYSISGTVRDKKETLPGAAIYLSGYKSATTTNNDGKFIITNLEPGTYDVLVQMIGYAPTSQQVVITDQSANVTITLTENTTTLSEVIIKPDPNREHYLNLFKSCFIGETPNSAKCKILNTNALIIDYDKNEQLLTVRANELIVIENQALGYRIKYLLNTFEYNYKSKMIYYAGQPAFEEMAGGSAKQKRWKKEREIAYQGSSDHFYRSLVANRLEQEGFQLFKRIEKPNVNRPPDSLINVKIRQLSMGSQGVRNLITYNGGDDSLSYWMKKKRESKTIAYLNKAPILVDTLLTQHNEVFKSMRFEDALYVVFKNENEPTDFSYTGHRQVRPMEVGNAQVSVIHRLEPKIFLYPNGAVANPRATLYNGLWAYQKVADSVPLDYEPTTKRQ